MTVLVLIALPSFKDNLLCEVAFGYLNFAADNAWADQPMAGSHNHALRNQLVS